MFRTLFGATTLVAIVLGTTASYAADANRLFKAVDRDRSGALSQVEFKAFIDLMAMANDPKAQRIVSKGRKGYAFAWATADANGDRQITVEELGRL